MKKCDSFECKHEKQCSYYLYNGYCKTDCKHWYKCNKCVNRTNKNRKMR